jgi:hypothetical protein
MHRANLEIRTTHASFLRLSKTTVPLTDADRNVSAPGGAQPRLGAAAAKETRNKKPGVERRANPSDSCAAQYGAATRTEMLEARLFLPGIRDQPHLDICMRIRQTRSVRRLPGESEVNRHPNSIVIFCFASSPSHSFSRNISSQRCGLPLGCGKGVSNASPLATRKVSSFDSRRDIEVNMATASGLLRCV